MQTATRRVAHPDRFIAAFCGVMLCAGLASAEPPLFEQEPFDRVTLDKHNDHAVLKVQPLDFPGRRVPDPHPPRGEIKVRLVDSPDKLYEIQWHSIAKIELFLDLVLVRAGELVAAGELENAFDYFAFLKREDPKLPGLDRAIDDYLYEEAKTAQRDGQYEDALAMLRTLCDRNRNRQGLEKALGMATEALVKKRVEADDYWTARQLLANLRALYNEHPIAQKWQGLFQEEAGTQLTEGRELADAGKLREAHQRGRRMMHVWPDLAGGREFIDSLQKQYPRVVVGVTLPASEMSHNHLNDWPLRRTNRLVSRTLMEFVGRGTEGGRYFSPLGSMRIEELGLRLRFELRPKSDDPRSTFPWTGYDLARQLLVLTDPRRPTFRPDWADLVDRVSVRDVFTVTAELRRPHVRPEAILQAVVVVGRGFDAASTLSAVNASRPPSGPYRMASRDDDDIVYVSNLDYPAARPEQPREIVERFFPRGKDAIQALRRRRIDVLDRVNPWEVGRIRQLKNVTVEPYAVPLVHCLIPNSRRPLTSRRTFRRALIYGIHREAILSRLLNRSSSEVPGCRLISGPFSAGMSHDDPLDYAYDDSIAPRVYDPRVAISLAKAAYSEVLAAASQNEEPPENAPAKEADKAGGEAGERRLYPLVLAHPGHEIARVACASIKAQLDLIKIPVELRELPPGGPGKLDDDVDLLYAELAVWEPVVDARRLLDPHGLAGASSSHMSLALRQLDVATEWSRVADELRAVHRLAFQEVAVIPLWQLTDHFAYHRSLRGIGSEPVTLYQDVEMWRPVGQYVAEKK